MIYTLEDIKLIKENEKLIYEKLVPNKAQFLLFHSHYILKELNNNETKKNIENELLKLLLSSMPLEDSSLYNEPDLRENDEIINNEFIAIIYHICYLINDSYYNDEEKIEIRNKLRNYLNFINGNSSLSIKQFVDINKDEAYKVKKLLKTQKFL